MEHDYYVYIINFFCDNNNVLWLENLRGVAHSVDAFAAILYPSAVQKGYIG